MLFSTAIWAISWLTSKLFAPLSKSMATKVPTSLGPARGALACFLKLGLVT